MDKLQALLEERGKLIGQLEELAEKTDWTDEDQSKFDKIEADIRTLDKKIRALQVVEAHEREALRSEENAQIQEVQEYSIAGAIRELIDNQGRLEGVTREMHQQGVEESNKAGVTLQYGGKGLVIPHMVLGSKRMSGFQNTMEAGDAAKGGRAIETTLGTFIDKLRERLVLAQLGADFMTGLVGNIDFPVEDVLPVWSWKAEITDHAKSQPRLQIKTMKPKRGGTYVDLSNLLLRQTSPSIDARIERQLVGTAQRGIELAGIAGTGANDQPEGILNTSGIGDVAGGTDGLAPTHDHIVDLETEIAKEDADIARLAYLTNTLVRGKLKKTKVDAGSGQFVWAQNSTQLNGYDVGVTNLVPSDLTKGTGTGLSAIIFGNFEDLILGWWGGIEMQVDPYTQNLKSVTRLVVNAYVDVLVARPVSFAAMKDAITT